MMNIDFKNWDWMMGKGSGEALGFLQNKNLQEEFENQCYRASIRSGIGGDVVFKITRER